MKKLYADILMTGLLCSAALTVNAFEYVSSEAGFSVNIPEQNIMLIGENMFAAENRVFDVDKKLVKPTACILLPGLTTNSLNKILIPLLQRKNLLLTSIILKSFKKRHCC